MFLMFFQGVKVLKTFCTASTTRFGLHPLQLPLKKRNNSVVRTSVLVDATNKVFNNHPVGNIHRKQINDHRHADTSYPALPLVQFVFKTH